MLLTILHLFGLLHFFKELWRTTALVIYISSKSWVWTSKTNLEWTNMNQRSTQARCPSEHIVTNTCQQRRLFIVPCFMRSYRKPNKKLFILHVMCQKKTMVIMKQLIIDVAIHKKASNLVKLTTNPQTKLHSLYEQTNHG